MRIAPDGNVGIGTPTPAQMLSVAGTIESTAGGFKFPDGTTQTTAAGALGNPEGRNTASSVGGARATTTGSQHRHRHMDAARPQHRGRQHHRQRPTAALVHQHDRRLATRATG